jgi:transposase
MLQLRTVWRFPSQSLAAELLTCVMVGGAVKKEDFEQELREWAADAGLRVDIDVLGRIATLLSEAGLAAGIGLAHIPDLVINTDQSHQRKLQAEAGSELDAEIQLLVGRRREMVTDQTRRISRLRDLLASIHPGLEAVVNPIQKGSQRLLMGYVTPAEIRRAGRHGLIKHLAKAGRLSRSHVEQLADDALAAAQAQTVAQPGESVASGLVRELAGEASAARERIATLDIEIEATLARHPGADLIRSMPGMGVVLTAAFIAEVCRIERFLVAYRLAGAMENLRLRSDSGTS